MVILLCIAEYVQDCQASEFTEDPNFLLDFSKSSNESINKLISFIKKNQGQEVPFLQRLIFNYCLAFSQSRENFGFFCKLL